jgi:RecA-family ATPase
MTSRAPDSQQSAGIPEPDFIMGHWLTTTSRVLLTAATGLGKTNFGLALAMRVAAGEDFLHWRGHRPCRVLYIDGEMSRRLLRERVLDEEKRIGVTPECFFALIIAAFVVFVAVYGIMAWKRPGK